MTSPLFYPHDRDSFDAILRRFVQATHPKRRLPDWPFGSGRGNLDVCQFSHAIEGPFGPVLKALASTYSDEEVSLAVLDPSPQYYRDGYGSYPGFVLPGDSIDHMYWEAVAHEPSGDPTGAVIFSADVVMIAGSSGKWAVWAERSWDLALLLSDSAEGAWLSVGVDFVPVEEALIDFTEPFFKNPLDADDREKFLRNVRQFGRPEY